MKISIVQPTKCDIYLEQNTAKTLKIIAPYNPFLIAEFQAMIGYRWDKEKRVTIISDCPRNVSQLMMMKGINPFNIFDKELLNITPNRNNLKPHQKLMLNHNITRTNQSEMGGALIAGDMGVGKTLAAIETLEYWASQGLKEFWYVAPKSALHPFAGIPQEFKKWKSGVTPEFMTYEAIRTLVSKTNVLMPDGIILDESSLLKNPTTLRSQAILGVSEQMRAKGNCRIVLLSGTPAPKDPTDWWHQSEVGAPGLLRESNTTKLRSRLAVIEMRDGLHRTYPHLDESQNDKVKLLYRRLAGFVLRIRASECLTLPPCTEINHYIKPSQELLRVAKSISNNTTSTLEKLQKLRQLSDGFLYDEDKKTIWGGSAKMDAMKEWLENSGNRCVIYAGYTASIDKICEECEALEWKVGRVDGRGWKGITEAEFQAKDDEDNLINDDKMVIVAHPKSGGMSLNFTASNTLIYYSNDFDGQARMQSSKRVDRLGQTRANKIINLLHLPTDELILNNLKNKKDLQSLSLNDLDEYLSKPKDESIIESEVKDELIVIP